MRVAQVTSSPIKNVSSVLEDWGNVGEEGTRMDGTLYRERKPDVDPAGYDAVGVRWDIREVKGDLNHENETFVVENHLCVVDIPDSPTGVVGALFVGIKGGKPKTAWATVPLGNDPKTFVPSPKTPVRTTVKRAVKAILQPLEAEQPEPVMLAAVGGPPGIYEQTAIEDAMGHLEGGVGLHDQARAGGSAVPTPPPPSPATRATTDAKVPCSTASGDQRAGQGQGRPLGPGGIEVLQAPTGLLPQGLPRRAVGREGRAAAEAKIGKTFAGPATAGDRWEEARSRSLEQAGDPGGRASRPAASCRPSSRRRRTSSAAPTGRSLPNIDVPQLIGNLNMGRASTTTSRAAARTSPS